MSADADFMGYVGARWPSLVRTLVLLGCPEDAAGEVALDALARLQKDWAAIERTVDVDAAVNRELLAAWDRFCATPWWHDHPPGSLEDAEVVAALDRLGRADRADLVLSRYGGAAARGVLPAEPGSDRLRQAVDLVPVLAPPASDQIREHRRGVVRRRWRRTLSVAVPAAVAVVAVAAGGAWLTGRGGSEDDDLSPLKVTLTENPIQAIWEGSGVVHLPHGTVEVGSIRQLAPFGDGAIYADLKGRVVQLGDDGTRTLLGTKAPDMPFASSDDQGWVAWVDPRGSAPHLVVEDAVSHTEVGRATLSKGSQARPIAIDDDTVWFQDAKGDRGWQPLTQPAPGDVVEPSTLLDVQSRTRVYQVGPETIRVQPAVFDTSFDLTGTGAALSRDGSFVVTRLGGPGVGYGRVISYDTQSGTFLPSFLTPDETALAVEPGPDGTIDYLVARSIDLPKGEDYVRASFSGDTELRECQLPNRINPDGGCISAAHIPATGVPPLLGH